MASPPPITITLPDGAQREVPHGTTIAAVAQAIGRRLGRDAVGGIVDGAPRVVDVHTPLTRSCRLKIVTVGSDEGLEVLRHSTAHLMAAVVQKLFKGTQVTIGPATATGFYYDFYREGGFAPADLERVEAEMVKLAAQDEPFVREEVTRAEAEAIFAGLGETYKGEILARIPADEPITLYRLGPWLDLCRGPHVPSAKFLRAFKLTHTAGAYWRGDEKNPMLARIYGTAFWTQEDLAAHLAQQEEAKRRDHRRLGKDLDLFSFHPWAPAMPFFHPRGTVVVNGLFDLVRRYARTLNFDEVISPQIFDVELFKQSGHYNNYRDAMFFCAIDEREFGLKPMNCPGHTLLYAAQKRSYRDLPIRYADFGRLHRYERSGTTAGLTRVRSFCQDDAHIFCRPEQVGDEIELQILLVEDIYTHFGFEMRVNLSTRPERSLGREAGLSAEDRATWDEMWGQAEGMLQTAIARAGLQARVNPGDGAFYGPKIDYEVKDAIGRWHQLGTIQLDFGLPKRFDLAYTDRDSSAARPVMIHRAVLGSIERFMGILLEHCGGDLPLWLAPEQLRVLPIRSDDPTLMAYADKVVQAMRVGGLRVGLDKRGEKLGMKIREAELARIPALAVLGQREAAAETVALRLRKKGDQGGQPLDEAVLHMVEAAAVPQPGVKLLQRLDMLSSAT